MKTYIETKINFGLKDFNNTFNKYKDYKIDKFKTILSSYQKSNFYYGCERYLYNQNYYLDLIYKKDKSKSDIRALKTGINYSMMLYLQNVVEPYSNNENEKKNFAIKLYIEHYKTINDIMKELLTDLICGTE